MIDTLLANLPHLRPPVFWADEGLQPSGHFVMTMQWPASVDDHGGFSWLLCAVGEAVAGLPVVFPVHPRTDKTLAALPDKPASLMLVDPQPYLELNYLVRHARGVITDSGGVTEKTTVMDMPCVTLRDTTERPETVTIDIKELLGIDSSPLKPARDRLLAGRGNKGAIPETLDECARERVAESLDRLLCS